jgi:hypothetical protein
MLTDVRTHWPPLIRVTLHKSCYLLLTWQEYPHGIKRGKAHKRREAHARRVSTTDVRPAYRQGGDDAES